MVILCHYDLVGDAWRTEGVNWEQTYSFSYPTEILLNQKIDKSPSQTYYMTQKASHTYFNNLLLTYSYKLMSNHTNDHVEHNRLS